MGGCEREKEMRRVWNKYVEFLKGEDDVDAKRKKEKEGMDELETECGN